MNVLLFITLGVTSFFFEIYAGDCNDNDTAVVFNCYNAHLNRFNYTSRIYEYVFTVLNFSPVQGKSNCTIFEELGNCIGEDRWKNCVSPESLSKILGKSKEEATDFIYLYQRFRIYCSYFSELTAGNKSTVCYDPASINSCTYDRLSHRKYYSASNCGLFPSYLDCSLRQVAGRCGIPYAKMHCDFMNLFVPIYHSYCNLQPFNCSKFNYTEESIVGALEYSQLSINYAYFTQFYAKYVDSTTWYSRYFYATIFIAIFFSMVRKKSSLKSSFFALFLLIPLYDIIYVLVYILILFPSIDMFLQKFSVPIYLRNSYGILMPLVLFVMSLNRFTAINFPLRHGNIWKRCLTTCLIAITIFLTILIAVLQKFILDSESTSFLFCQTVETLHCYFRKNFDMEEVSRTFDIFLFLFPLSLCGISIALLCATIIRYQICLKKQASDILKTAEKRLLLITCVEVILTIIYTTFFNIMAVVWNFQLQYLTLHTKPVVLVHHFSSIALFFLFSKATRDAYIQFFYLDVIYGKVIKFYPFSKITNRKDKIVSIASSDRDRRRTN